MQLCSHWIPHPSWQELIALKWIVYRLLAHAVKINARSVNSVSSPEPSAPRKSPATCSPPPLIAYIKLDVGRKREEGGKHWNNCFSSQHLLAASWENTRAIHQSPHCCLPVFNSLRSHCWNTNLRPTIYICIVIYLFFSAACCQINQTSRQSVFTYNSDGRG